MFLPSETEQQLLTNSNFLNGLKSLSAWIWRLWTWQSCTDNNWDDICAHFAIQSKLRTKFILFDLL